MAKVIKVNKGKPEFSEIRRFYEEKLHPDKINFDDQKVYEYIFHDGRWAGIFQATEKATQNFFTQCKPSNVTDIAAITSTWRPGPLAGGMHELYVDAKFNKPYDWGHQLINDVLKETYGCLLFQEQVMSLANKVAGYDLDKTDQVRRAIFKRSLATGEALKKEAQELRETFIQGCVNNSIPKKIAERLYDNILAFGGYGFNRSLHEQTLIKVNKNGKKSDIPISQIKSGDQVYTRDEKTKQICLTEVLNLHDHGVQPLVEVELTTGEKIKCTMDHKFRTVETGEMLPLWLINQQDYSIVVNDAIKD